MISFASCNVYPPYTSFGTYIDYSLYSEKGFFITESNSVSFEYESIASITMTDESGSINSDLKHPDLNKMIEDLYQLAIKKGANGVINLKIEYWRIREIPFGYGLNITGMLIKRT
jgi:uncharacterized protein YbjQ (UPF0145 family)